MANIHAISKERHIDSFWKPQENYGFTSGDALSLLFAQEIPLASLSLPIAFTLSEGVYLPVAVLGTKAGQNAFVDRSGSWLASYIPRSFRCYPFSLAVSGEQKLLCIDEDVGLTDNPALGKRFFLDNGEVDPMLVKVLEFLNSNLEFEIQTTSICGSLQELDLFEPWPLEIKNGAESLEIQGLFRVNETNLNLLSPNELIKLRDNRALVVVYSQLISMHHIKEMANLAQRKITSNHRQINFNEFEDSGTLSFDNL